MLGKGKANWNEFFTRPLLSREEGLCIELAERVSSTELKSNIEWEIGWKQVEGFSDFFVLCNNVQMAGFRKRLWLIAIAAACWTIWLAINGLIFDNRRMSVGISKIHFCNLLLEVPSSWMVKIHRQWVEFEEKAGCGGILRDIEGPARALFSGAVVANITEEAEIEAVKIALDVFTAMNWKPKESLIIEVGSVVAFAWCVNKALRLWSLLSVFAEFESAILKVGTVVFSLADRKGNVLASSLAIAGVNRPQMFKAWW
ncbi:hypothetical protein PVK06_003543 [Gossypium arboreum]|uniref:RNase H type-1 domain-containing protein n=1 Tax=Gossypium arboreum TaxID=29729 RepID=A0ABR0R6R4_GOSAR|nr:hypothetical protein PVK06_003543 [Gossypium arboreum]